jgi:hypothetical protein
MICGTFFLPVTTKRLAPFRQKFISDAGLNNLSERIPVLRSE